MPDFFELSPGWDRAVDDFAWCINLGILWYFGICTSFPNVALTGLKVYFSEGMLVTNREEHRTFIG